MGTIPEIPEGHKRCTKCGEVKPATTEYFNIHSKKRLRNNCRKCQNAYNKIWRKENYQKYRDGNRRWLLAHPEKRKEYNRRYLAKNPHKIMEYTNRYRQKFPERVRESYRQYGQKNTEKIRQKARKRLTRKMSLPHCFSIADEARALDYWHGCCAVCGQPLQDLFGKIKPHMDHWIALSDPRQDNPGTVPTNMLPLCSSCNTSKFNYAPLVWLESKYGRRKATQIARRVEEFFEWTATQAEDKE